MGRVQRPGGSTIDFNVNQVQVADPFAGGKIGKAPVKALLRPNPLIDRQGEQRARQGHIQHRAKGDGADMASGKGARRGDAVVHTRQVQRLCDIGTEQPAINPLVRRDIQHLLRKIQGVDLARKPHLPQRPSQQPGAGADIQHRPLSLSRNKSGGNMGGQVVLHVGGKAAVIGLRPIAVQRQHGIRASQGKGGVQVGHHDLAVGTGCRDTAPMNTLLSIGHGYSAQALSRRLIPQGWRVIGTTRTAEKATVLAAMGVEPLIWPGDIAGALAQATHLLTSVAPDAAGDPVVRALGPQIAAAGLHWVGYLSTTAVYGHHNGDWVDEGTALTPSTARGAARVRAEGEWAALGLPLHIFRLAGIYGPGRGPFEKVRDGTARRILKPGQVFSRIHVEDIAGVLEASLARPRPGAVYNVCDDDPASPEDVLSLAASLLALPEPPMVPYEQAEMTPMARSFYAENKRVRNTLIKDELGVRLRYPTYREGLAALLADEPS